MVVTPSQVLPCGHICSWEIHQFIMSTMASQLLIYLGVSVFNNTLPLKRPGAFTSMLTRLAKGKARTRFVALGSRR
jgi:hypothetical protein